MTLRILHLEDDPNDALLTQMCLQDAGMDALVLLVNSRQGFQQALQDHDYDVVLADNSLPGFSGLEALEFCRAHRPKARFISLCGYLPEADAEKYASAGAVHLSKDRLQELPQLLTASAVPVSAEAPTGRPWQPSLFEHTLKGLTFAVAHDLGGPFLRIRAYAQMLESARLDESGQAALQLIKAEAQRGVDMIAGVQGLARVWERELKPQSVPVASLLAEIPLRAKLRQRLPEGFALRADPELLKMALESLLSNADKFSSENPAAEVEVGAQDAQTVYVRDNGVGFDLSSGRRLFMPFQRLHPEDRFPGLGVGLAVVQQVACRHGGSVWAEAAPNQGATFYLRFPPERL